MEDKELQLRAAFQILFSASAEYLHDTDEDKAVLAVLQDAIKTVGDELYPGDEATDLWKVWHIHAEPRRGRKNFIGTQYMYTEAVSE
jgi:hypothetical protein